MKYSVPLSLRKIAYIGNEIVGLYSAETPDPIVRNEHPKAMTFLCNTPFTLEELQERYIVKGEQLVYRPSIMIWPTKEFIAADGKDTCRVEVKVLYSEPVDSVTLLVNGIPVTVDLTDNCGEFLLSAEDGGEYFITVPPEEGYQYVPKVVTAR